MSASAPRQAVQSRLDLDVPALRPLLESFSPARTGISDPAVQYLITAYGREDSDNDAVGHRVLGSAMTVLHARPIMDRSEIKVAPLGNYLADQFEPLKITPLPIGLDEISKLWTTPQCQYRISTAYQVTVALR